MATLKELRTRARLTQVELARRAGLRQATISGIENGRTRPHRSTLAALARALDLPVEDLQGATGRAPGEARDWAFLDGLDADLREGLVQALVAEWTHSSTAIEGNTISAGDTLFVITHGLTVSGKSLREHQEIHGHAQAISLLAEWTGALQPVRVTQMHELHRAVQTGVVVDVLAPVGSWKVERNGTMAITTRGATEWHDYAAPYHVPALIDQWVSDLATATREAASLTGGAQAVLVRIYTEVHLGFVGIHPYADGNGRMARLLANVPLLRAGQPPLLVSAAARRDYLALLGDYSLARGRPRPGEPLVWTGRERDAVEAFFIEQWATTHALVASWRKRQAERSAAQ